MKKGFQRRSNKTSMVFMGIIFLLALNQRVISQETPQSSEPTESGSFRGPDSAGNRIQSDRADKDSVFDFNFSRSYYEWKDNIQEEYGYSFGASYIANYFKASDSLPGKDDYASGAVFRFFGRWELLGRGTETMGSLNYLFEHRHPYADTTPTPFSIDNIGNAGAIGIPFDRDKWHLTNLYWDQSWQNGQFEIFAGWLDVTDFVDVYPLTSPWTDYSNFVFSIGAATMDLPDDAAMGLAAGTWLNDTTYMMAGFEDLNSDPGDPMEGFDTFFNDNEYFKHIEIGWTGSGKEQYYLDNFHITLWHSDQRDESGVEDGWGTFLSYSRPIGEQWLLFARGGFADDGGSLLDRSVSLGGGYQPDGTDDWLGFGVNWGQPNDNLFGSGLNDQYATEVYYRMQVTKELAITPDIQLLIDPALNPEENHIWVFGLRARLAF